MRIPNSLLSTKVLTAAQQELILNTGLSLTHYDALKTIPINSPLHLTGDAIIITSKNALPALDQVPLTTPVFCVGTVTASLIKNHSVQYTATSAQDLAAHLTNSHKNLSYDYLCSDHRRDELPDILNDHKIRITEHIVYRSVAILRSFDRIFAAVLFYSPRGVSAFAKANNLQPHHAICIGETTATEAKKWFKNVQIANKSTVENTIVTAIKLLRND